MNILAIDPGPVRSAWVWMHAGEIGAFDCQPNAQVLRHLEKPRHGEVLALEMIASYGMSVGAEVFETCVWIGQFLREWERQDGKAERIFRREVKLHLCGQARAKDGNIRQALIDRYGGKESAIGRKATPGPLYGMSGDVWAALAVAVTYADTRVLSAAG